MNENNECTDLTEQIGQKLRTARSVMCVTQMELANQIGVSYQQIQKYEKGEDRISVDTLFRIVKALRVVPISYFFKGLKLESKK